MYKRFFDFTRRTQIGSPDGPVSGRGFPWDAVGVLAVSLVCLLPYFHLPPSDADEGLITAGAERILRGQIPFRDFFSELGPASFYLQAGIFKVAGVNVNAVRLTAWLLGGAISGLIYLLARRLMPRTRAVLASSIFPLMIYPLNYRVDHHWWGNLFLLLMVLCILASFSGAPESIQARGRRWLFLGGMLAALTLLSMQTKGLWAIVMTSVFLIAQPSLGSAGNWRAAVGKGSRDAAWFLAGAGAWTGAAAIYFLYHGAAGAWLEDNFLFLLDNYWTYSVDVPQASALRTLVHLGHLAVTQWSVYFNLYFINTLFLLVIAPVVAFGGTVWQLFAGRHPLNVEARVLILLLLESLGAFFSEAHAQDEYHLGVAAPLMLVLLVYQWGLLSAGHPMLRRLTRGAAIVAVACMLAVAGRKANIAFHINGPVSTRRGVLYVRPAALNQTRTVINTIQDRIPPGGETFVYPYVAELYFYTATRNPTRFDALLPGFHSAGQINETIARLKSARPGCIFSFEKIQRWTIRPHFPDDPPDAVFPHPVGKALAETGSGYRVAETFENGYSTGHGRHAEVVVWALDPSPSGGPD